MIILKAKNQQAAWYQDPALSKDWQIDKEDVLSLYPEARAKVFTPDNISNGLAGAGVKPLDQDRVLAKITFQLRTPTPPALVEGSVSSAFQTPQNTCQLGHEILQLAEESQ